MRQSIQSRLWQCSPLITSGSSVEAGIIARIAHNEEFILIHQEVKPSRGLLPRHGK
ncbi:hypothetical protein GCM10008013_32170 [Paenibacillus segetis]|uniref:Uncharacterized protein n=1 Tax=Paenibacillus segetis TaxID=1325360 RepID=A0ABQ1YKF8_9BACL|nr:hypothetical protein GCM10008013_32170 [Paenibacillus segetis]